jgi:dUTP pyrophosphatase
MGDSVDYWSQVDTIKLQQKLGVYCLHDDMEIPVFATDASACFDIRAYLRTGNKITSYNTRNNKIETILTLDQYVLLPHWRALITTGLIFDIPKGHHIKVHPRSGNALKKGLVTANNTGVIDEDYVLECMCIMINDSEENIVIEHGDRITQAELCKTLDYVIGFQINKPGQKTDRDGGFGSTGT